MPPPDQLQEVQHELKQTQKNLDLYVTLYTRQIIARIVDYLNQIDVITLWTWETAELENLEANLFKLEQIAPHVRKILGCYTAALNPHHGVDSVVAFAVAVFRKQSQRQSGSFGRRLISLIFASRSRIILIRRELSLTKSASPAIQSFGGGRSLPDGIDFRARDCQRERTA